MSEKWARGPWSFNGSTSIRDAYNRPIATVRSCDPKMDGSHNENRDTANIMTAAPDLYAALNAIIDDLPISRDWLDPVNERWAKDALKKARGES